MMYYAAGDLVGDIMLDMLDRWAMMTRSVTRTVVYLSDDIMWGVPGDLNSDVILGLLEDKMMISCWYSWRFGL